MAKADAFFTHLFKRPQPVILLFALVALFSLTQIFDWPDDIKNWQWKEWFQIQLDSDFKNLLPDHIQAKIDTDKIEELFGGNELVYIAFETEDVLAEKTLERIKNISNEFTRLRELDEVISLFESKRIYGDEEAMHVSSAIKEIPTNEVDREKLRQELLENPITRRTVISEDSTVSVVMGIEAVGALDADLTKKIQAILIEYPGDETVYLGGMPYVRDSMIANMGGDLLLFMPAGLLLMLVFLAFFFRQARGAILPFVVVIFSIQLSFLVVSLFGWKLELPMMILPVSMIAIANDYGIHMITRYQEELSVNPNLDRKEIARRLPLSLGKPVLMTGITTIGGFLCLLTNTLTAVKKLALLSSIGIAYALFASIIFIPAVIALLPPTLPKIHTDKNHGLNRLLAWLGESVVRRKKGIILTTIIATVVISTGAFLIKVDANPESYYPYDNPLNVGSRLLNNKLGGSQNISLLMSDNIASPEAMKRLQRYEDKFEELPQVDSASSIATSILEISKAIYLPEDPEYNKIPDSEDAIRNFLFLYEISGGDPEDFDKFLDYDYENAQLLIRVNDASTEGIRAVTESVREIIAGDDSIEAMGGWSVILDNLADLIIDGQIKSLSLALVIIGGLIAILFRSVKGGLFGIIPLLISLLIVFGAMGYFHLTLNISTVMISSIMVGIGVDYTIHYLWRYREERQNGLNYEEATKKTLLTTGRGIIFNALSVIFGFTVLFFSAFQPIQFFGMSIVLSVASCLVGALVLIPSLCLTVKPKFLEPK